MLFVSVDVVWHSSFTDIFSGIWDVYDWVAYPEGMTSVGDSIRHLIGIGTTSGDIFSRDIRSACAVFLPSPDAVMDMLCNPSDIRGQTAEDFLRMVEVIANKPVFTATAKDMEKFISEVRQCLSVIRI